jgi:hypothetical protein
MTGSAVSQAAIAVVRRNTEEVPAIATDGPPESLGVLPIAWVAEDPTDCGCDRRGLGVAIDGDSGVAGGDSHCVVGEDLDTMPALDQSRHREEFGGTVPPPSTSANRNDNGEPVVTGELLSGRRPTASHTWDLSTSR